ncbi:MAG: YbdK family carboxylate-amine ligase [Aquificae bacterium]|nr:YbdK family carboxylate-amine ligase [Aquificota bacterium]
MEPLRWKRSEPLTVGLEWELQILDRETLEPKDAFPELFERLPEDLKPFVHKEVYQSMLEVVSAPSEDEGQIADLLGRLLEALRPLAQELGFHLVGLGTLYSKAEKGTKINADRRYKLFAEEFQHILRDFYIYGIHFHVGFPDEDWALRAFNNFVKYAPLFLALSANSPFYRGVNTGIHSYRMVVFEKLPRAELPRQFSSFGEFAAVVEHLKGAGAIERIKDLWWHVRFRPDLGTVEFRVFDSLWSVERILTLVKLVRSLALYSERYQDPPLAVEYLQQNWWWAKRYSLDADFVDHQGRKALKQVAFDLVYKLEHLGIFDQLGYSVDEFTHLLRRPSLAKDLILKSHALGLERVVRSAAVV